VAVIADAGHASNVEAPDQFNSEVRNFLKSVASETPATTNAG